MCKRWDTLKKVRLHDGEKKFGTSGNLAVFHKIAEGDGGLGLRFPGYIIGIEKAKRVSLGLPDSGEPTISIQEENFPNEEYYKEMIDYLDESKPTFIFHIFKYSLNDEYALPYIGEHELYNVYDPTSSNLFINNAYENSREQITILKKNIQEDFEKEAYTHIFLYSMGWNTDQQESLRNYNSLVGHMIKEAPDREKKFKPLFIGISWPSEWYLKIVELFDGIAKLVSYPFKSDDADEIGATWANYLLRDVLIPLKKEHNKLRLVLVGHSFGARLITRAVFGIPSLNRSHHNSDIDLVVSLQGAFSVRRFIPKDGFGGEGEPYLCFPKYA